MFLAQSILLVMAAAPVPKPAEPKYYFPTEVGVKWELLISGQPNREDIRHSYVISAVEEKDGAKIVSLKRTVEKVTYNAGKVTVTTEGVSDSGSKDNGFDPPLPILKSPFDKDATWKWKGKYGENGRSQTRTIVGTEEITVPAGKFTALKVNVVEERDDTDHQFKRTEWHVLNVGRVKGVTGNLVEEMTSFTPVKK
jgi:hypothetical protein